MLQSPLMKNSPISPKLFQKKLLAWFDQFGRKNLPWQRQKNPYRVWVSEIMLQQTQVQTVIPYFERFMAKFPTIDALATADEDTVLHLWTGLGYYQRARHLLKAARQVLEVFSGKLPSEVMALMTLPGIGRSTAGAIRSLAFEQPAIILDGNVKRVLSRLFAIQTVIPDEKLWEIAASYSSPTRCADYTQAIMDLGATLCVRGTPQCYHCPFNKHCLSFLQGIEKTLPLKKPRKHLPIKTTQFAILQFKNGVLLEKRPGKGVWSGLWSFPEMSEKEFTVWCQQTFQCQIKKITKHPTFRHSFTHFHLDITPIFFQVVKNFDKAIAEENYFWYNLHQQPEIGLPAPVKSILSSINP